MTRAPVAVLGLGNELFTDEGVGIAASRRIADLGLTGVDVLDGGTLGITLLPEIAGRTALLVLDAIVGSGWRPGEVVSLDSRHLTRPNLLLFSAHQIGVQETLLAARLAGQCPERVAAIGMVPFSLDTGYGLSAAATCRLDEMVEAALDVLASWDVEVLARAR